MLMFANVIHFFGDYPNIISCVLLNRPSSGRGSPSTPPTPALPAEPNAAGMPHDRKVELFDRLNLRESDGVRVTMVSHNNALNSFVLGKGWDLVSCCKDPD